MVSRSDQRQISRLRIVDSAAVAPEWLERKAVDAVLLDVNLAGEQSGVDVAQAAREAEVPVLLLTGNVPVDAADLAIAALAKPYAHRDLAAALRAMGALVAGRPLDKHHANVRLFAAS
jgi:DNA-binding response OmpR family regulator